MNLVGEDRGQQPRQDKTLVAVVEQAEAGKSDVTDWESREENQPTAQRKREGLREGAEANMIV